MAFGRPERDIEGFLDRRGGLTDDEDFNLEYAVNYRKDRLAARDFSPQPYSDVEVARDTAEIERIKKSPEYVHESGIA